MNKNLSYLTKSFEELGIQIESLRNLNEGLESTILIGYSLEEKKEVAIKIPKEIIFNNDNDQNFSAMSLYTQEYRLLRLLKQMSFPVPEVYHFDSSNKVPFIIMELLKDVSTPTKEDFVSIGRLTRTLHSYKAPELNLVAMERFTDINELILHRLYKRFNIIADFGYSEGTLPPISLMSSSINHIEGEKCLLHMDIRPQNILKKTDNDFLFTDWSNALIGYPALEIARLQEYGEFFCEFMEGYGELTKIDKLPMLIYRLDTAIMLSVVFLSEEPNPIMANTQLKRVSSILKEIKKEL
ncbi:phosphotransferase family protein [Bacillus fonticola]|uniref:phosphotransferase family protein n=1 Tax=Bacillus fonticola TaxID=2728853 RepID=UPI001475D34D|nr:phosphotransferase [Bacillus fonticola]